MKHTNHARTLLLAGSAAMVGFLGVTAAPASAAVAPQVAIDFDTTYTASGSTLTSFGSQGSANVTTSIVTDNAGVVQRLTYLGVSGGYANFPMFNASSSTGPRAVLAVVPAAGSLHALDPGTKNFTFAAGFTLQSEPTQSSASGSGDNGNNLVQRGLYGTRSQYKIQIDRRVPQCQIDTKINGVETVQTATSSVTVDATHWYAANCTRTGTKLELVVYELINGTLTKVSDNLATPAAHPLDLTYDNTSTPFTIGGKLGADAKLMAASDQFNGAVDNVSLTIG